VLNLFNITETLDLDPRKASLLGNSSKKKTKNTSQAKKARRIACPQEKSREMIVTRMMQMVNKTKTNNVKWLVIINCRSWTWGILMKVKRLEVRKSQMNYPIQGKLKVFFSEFKVKGRYKIEKVSERLVLQNKANSNNWMVNKQSRLLIGLIKY